MKIFRTSVLAISLLAFLSVPALAQTAQTKIATVDLQKILKGFWKVQRMQALLQQRSAKDQSDDKDMIARLKKMDDDYQQLLAQANDQAISSDERDKRKQAAADKLKELQSEKVNVDQFERQEMSTLDDQRQRMVKSSLDEIKTAVAAKAKVAGYSIVLDTSARTLNLGAGSVELPSEVVYSSGDDLTDAILAQLNAGAPIDAVAPVVESPSPSLMNTNNP